MPSRKQHKHKKFVKCSWHITGPYMSYLQTSEDAERRMKAGQKQKRCPHCKLWIWPDKYGIAPNTKQLKTK
jgi:hypothetical protein